MLFLVLLFLLSFNKSSAECNVCGTESKSACLSRNSFHMCDGETPNADLGLFYCPQDLICVDDTYRCLPAETNVPSCGFDCEICDTQTHVACMTEKTFALCFEENGGPSRILGFCKNEKVCNAKSPLICVDPELMKPSCPDYSHTTTTPASTSIDPTIATTIDTSIPTFDPPITPSIPTIAPSDDPYQFCQKQQKNGKYPIPGNCNSFIICMMSGNDWIGKIYNCLRGGLFDCKIQQCKINGTCDYSCSYIRKNPK